MPHTARLIKRIAQEAMEIKQYGLWRDEIQELAVITRVPKEQIAKVLVYLQGPPSYSKAESAMNLPRSPSYPDMIRDTIGGRAASGMAVK